MPYPVARSQFQLGKETIPGTAVPPTVAVPAKSMLWTPNITEMYDDTLQGSMVDVYSQVAGQRHDSYDYSTNLYLDSVGHLLEALLGGADVVTGAGPYTHTLPLLNSGPRQPPTDTLCDYNGSEWVSIPYAKLLSLAIKNTPGGLAQFTPKWLAFPGTTGAANASPPSISAVTPAPAWCGVVSIGGTNNTEVVDLTVDLTRGTTATEGLTGLQTPINIWSGVLSAKATVKMLWESDAILNYYLNNTAGEAVHITWAPPLLTGQSLSIQMDTPMWSMGKVTRGKEQIETEMEIRCVANATDAGASGGVSHLKAVLVNQQAATY